MFTVKPKSMVEEFKPEDANPPVDKVASFNYPYSLRGSWLINAVQDNLWRLRLQDRIVLGTKDTTTVLEGEFYFEHVVRDVYWYQFAADGITPANDALTWEWGREVNGAYYPIRAGDSRPNYTGAVEDILYRSNQDNYRWDFDGTATNIVEVEMWVEVLRI
jgi:hypothetical protein